MNLFHVIKKIDKLEIHDELLFDGKEYFTCEYNRLKKKMTQIGVSIKEDASRVVVKQFEREIALLTFDVQNSIWYHDQKQWVEDNYKQTTDSIFGINAGGSFEVLAYNEKDEQLANAIVNITPGTMSIEEYKQMQHEVRRLFELFSYDLSQVNINEENLLKRIQLPFYPQRQFKILIDQFVDCVNEIVKTPEQELIRIEKKVNLHQVKKWTPSIIIENAIKQNGKVTALISEKTTDIKENQMVKFITEEFQQRIEMELSVEQRHLVLLIDELQQLEDVEKKEQSNLVTNFRLLRDIVKSDCDKLEKRIGIWIKMSKKIDEILELPFLQCDSEVVEETHLFKMHPFYSEIYDIYTNYEELSPILSDTFRIFIQSLLKSPTLYEIWILLKIVQHLSQWGLNPYEFITDIQEKHINSKSISGYRKQFKLANKSFDIGLYYDFTFEETGYRPDFVIGFFNKKNRKWNFHTLDAKYKCYSKMKNGEKGILRDLEHSGTRYLNELFSGKVDLQSATLVHTDIESLNWNVKHDEVNQNRSQHKIAHFYLSPSESKNLSIYFKRLLHESSHFEYCCPNCGEAVEGIIEEKDPYRDKLRWKTTYICETCEEVWVVNFCSTCSYNDRGMRRIKRDGRYYRYPRPLYKYPINNYNSQVGDNWDVHCPTCYRTSNHWINYIAHENVMKGPVILD